MAKSAMAAELPVCSILDVSIDVVRSHFREFLITVSLPCSLLAFLTALVDHFIFAPSAALQLAILPAKVLVLVEAYRFMASPGVVYTWHLATNQPALPRQALLVAVKRWASLLRAFLWATLKEVVCFLALIAPYFIVLTRLSFLPHVMLLDGISARAAHKQSSRLVNVDFGRVGWVLPLVFGLQVLGMLLVLRLPEDLARLGTVTARTVMWDPVLAGAGYGLQVLALVLVMPVWAVASSLLFYSIKVKREGMDLRAKIEVLRVEYSPQRS